MLRGYQMCIFVGSDRAGPHGSRRRAAPPHHEGRRFCRDQDSVRRERSPHPEEPAAGGRLEGWPRRNWQSSSSFNCN